MCFGPFDAIWREIAVVVPREGANHLGALNSQPYGKIVAKPAPKQLHLQASTETSVHCALVFCLPAKPVTGGV